MIPGRARLNTQVSAVHNAKQAHIKANAAYQQAMKDYFTKIEDWNKKHNLGVKRRAELTPKLIKKLFGIKTFNKKKLPSEILAAEAKQKKFLKSLLETKTTLAIARENLRKANKVRKSERSPEELENLKQRRKLQDNLQLI